MVPGAAGRGVDRRGDLRSGESGGGCGGRSMGNQLEKGEVLEENFVGDFRWNPLLRRMLRQSIHRRKQRQQ